MKIRYSRARYISFLLVICLVTVFALPYREVFAIEYVISYEDGKQTDVYTDFSRESYASYGKSEMLSVIDLSSEHIVNYVGSPDQTFWVYDSRSAIKFDTSGIFGEVTSATLEIYVVDSVGNPYVNLYGADDDFVELESESTFPTSYESNMIINRDTSITTGSWKIFEVTNYVKDEIDAYSPYITFVLTGNQLVSGEDHFFNFVNDNDNVHPELRPVLRLNVEPTAPGAPRNVTVQDPENGKATVRFDAPISNGGATITEYIVTPYVGDIPESDKSATGTESPIEVTGLTNGTEYTFKVQAVNSEGPGLLSDKSNPVTPDTFPGKPTEVRAVAGREKATITFTAPTNEGSAITSYKVTPYIDGIAQDGKIKTGTMSPIEVTGLTGGTIFTFKVSAINGKGEGPMSEPSEEVMVTGLPGKPTIVSATRGDGQVEVTFTAPASDGGSEITSYKVTPYEGSIPLTAIEVPTAASPMTVTVTGLTNGTAYTFKVSATNDIGEGEASDASIAVTPATLPGAPTVVSAQRGDGLAVVTFTPPASNGGSAITGYTVTSNPGGFTGTGASSPITVTGLTNGTAYTYTVTATNGVGTGPSSTDSPAVIPATVPEAPTGVTVAKAGSGEVTVSFTAPASDGGSEITAYQVTPYIGTVAQTEKIATGVGSPIIVTGLTGGTIYTFKVSAINDVGEGMDTESTTITPTSVPGKPTVVSVTRGDGQVQVTFTPPASDGGDAITSYKVTPYKGSTPLVATEVTPAEPAASPMTATVTGLTNGIAYTFKVSATNDIGEGEASDASIAVTPETVPGAPTGVTAQRGDASAVVSFTPPASNGGSPITEYTVISSPGGFTGTGASSPITVTGLTNGTAYTFTVTATNEVGTGPSSTASIAVTPATVPGAPTEVGGIVTGNGEVTISFTTPASYGGSAITSYKVTPYIGTVAQTEKITTGVGSPIVVTGLTGGTTYTFKVSAINDVGEGIAAESTTITPTSVPGKPTAVTAIAGNEQATVSFIVPESDGGSPITSYKVTPYEGIAALTSKIVTGIGSPIIVTGLTNGTTYTFKVAAINGVGEGPDSDASSAVTPHDTIIPTKPTATTAAATNVATTTVTLNGTVNANNANTTVTFEYGRTTAYGNTKAADKSLVTGDLSTAVSVDITELTPNTTYHYRVVGVNEKGLAFGEDKTFTTTERVLTDTECVEADAAALTIGYANGDNASYVTKDIILPLTGENGSTITWTSSNTSVITNEGRVIRPTEANKTVTLTALISKNKASKTKIFSVTVNKKPSGGSSGGSSSSGTSSTSSTPSTPSTPSTSPKNNQPDVSINGNKVLTPSVHTQKIGVQTVTTVTLDEKALLEKIQNQGAKPVITIPIDTTSDKVQGCFSAYAVQKMGEKDAIVELKTAEGSYRVPVSQIPIHELAARLGKNVDLKDITISIEITNPSIEEINKIKALADKMKCNIVALPVVFNVKASYQGNTVEARKFSSYATRTIILPKGTNLERTLTGVMVGPGNTMCHMPTKIEKVGTEYFAQINSLESSGIYCIVSKSINFTDINDNWAREAIYDMGSRMIIGGTGNNRFEPNREITRAEFAAIVVKALGLKSESGGNTFIDVKSDVWYSGSVETAAAYGLISGYNDKTFKPSQAITREHAINIITRAAMMAGMSEEEAKFQAKQGVKGNITRAEVAELVSQLLQRSGLI